MGRTVFFNGRNIKKPGFYSEIKSGVKNNTFATLSYSGLLVIDTGSGAGWGMGAGIDGTLANNGDAIHSFNSLSDFQNEVKGGIWWKLADKLFLPDGTRASGITSIDYVRACETTPAEIALTFTNGSVTLQCKDEGTVANALRNDVLATALVTVTVAGAEADVITLKSGLTTLGSYTVGATPTIASVVTGLCNACVTLSATTGFTFSAKTGTTFTVTAPVNTGATANSYIPTITKTGTVAATVPGTFTGGVTGTKIVKGYAVKMTAGTVNKTKYKLVFLRGKWRGDDTLNLETGKSNQKTFLLSDQEEIGNSIEFTTLTELQSWMSTDANFKDYFKVKAFTITTAPGTVVSNDLTNLSTPQRAAGGTESYLAEHVDQALEYLTNTYASFILLDDYGVNAYSANNIKIIAWATLESRFKPQCYVACGTTAEDLTGDSTDSIETSIAYDNQQVTLVHGGCGYTLNGGGFAYYNSLVTAAHILGREAGIAPQIPLTQKSIGVRALVHKLSNAQQDNTIDYGVLTAIYETDYDPAKYVILKGCNSLQNNINNPPINDDNTTYSKQLYRIISQINKELEINGKRKFFGDVNGVNRFTASAGKVEAFVESFLKTKTVTTTEDNLLIGFGKIKAIIEGDTVRVTYEIEPNFEVNFILATGIVIDPTV